ncbi:hypothetical protein [Silvibacterium sp.]|uniref:hypothetical protein n=1 Tax=Silvibacterium sp. TaxID=1964179 RepID=UPI0039E5B1AD
MAQEISLPQALPGAAYNAQLSVPAGVGYPFTCTISGDGLPKGIVLDCERLQLKGKAPIAARDYHLALTLTDASGASLHFPLEMRVSDQPVTVSLGSSRSTTVSTKDAGTVAAANTVTPTGSNAGSVSQPIAQLAGSDSTGSTQTTAAGPAEKSDDAGLTLHPAVYVAPAVNAGAATAQEAEVAQTAATVPAITEDSPSKDDSTKPSKPAIVNTLNDGTSTISVQAQKETELTVLLAGTSGTSKGASANGEKKEQIKQNSKAGPAGGPKDGASGSGGSSSTQDPCDSGYTGTLSGLALKTGGTTVTASNSGVTNILLTHPLQAGTKLCVRSAINASTGQQAQSNTSDTVTVTNVLDWGRVRATFVAGTLISNSEDNFSSSQASTFLAANIEKFWLLPGCAMLTDDPPSGGTDGGGQCAGRSGAETGDPTQQDQKKGTTTKGSGSDRGKGSHFGLPGIASYFETRLTSIPVTSQVKSSTSTNSSTATSSASSSTSPEDIASTVLTSQKTATVGVGLYFPWVLTHWNYQQRPNALFLAPIARVGFNTLLGSSSSSTSTTGTATTDGTSDGSAATTTTTVSTLGNDRVYNYYVFGGRVGHFGLAKTENESPETLSYLDVAIGPYSNLQSYICQPNGIGTAIPAALTATDCSVQGLPNQTLKRIWRLDLEGYLKIPSTPFIIGMNANIGQNTLGAGHLDTQRKPGDDVRFLFGAKFDVSKVMNKLLGAQ